MKPGGQFGHQHVRLRQCISFFLLALFLGLFVGAMTAPAQARTQLATDHLVLSFPQAVTYAPTLNSARGELTITFPGMSMMALQKEYMQPFVASKDGAIAGVRVESDDAQGARLVVSVRNPDAMRVRLMRFAGPHQLMINVAPKDTGIDTRTMLSTSASLYNA